MLKETAKVTHNLKVDLNTASAKAVAYAVNHAIAVLGIGGLLATSMFPNASKKAEQKLAA